MNWLRNLTGSTPPKEPVKNLAPYESRSAFCNKCGSKMEYSTKDAFNKKTGKPYIAFWFNDCANESRYSMFLHSWTHDHEQYMEDFWLPLGNGGIK